MGKNTERGATACCLDRLVGLPVVQGEGSKLFSTPGEFGRSERLRDIWGPNTRDGETMA